MNQDLLANLSPYLPLSPLYWIAFFAPRRSLRLRLFPFVSAINERST
jgi:hypothetical protein